MLQVLRRTARTATPLRLLLAFAVLGALALVPVATPTYAQATSIILETSDPFLLANGTDTATITATVRDAANNPVAGETVTFTVAPAATFGSVSPVSGTTNAQGQVTTTFTAGTSDGLATVEGRTGALLGTVDIILDPPTPLPDELQLSANPTTIPGDDTTTTTLTALVTLNDQPVENYTVTFSTFHPGTFGSAGAEASGSITALTDANGVATATFRSPAGGTAFIRAVAEGGVADGTTEVTITPIPAAVDLQAAPSVVQPGAGNAITLSATVTQGAAAGNAPAAGVTVSFSTDFGTLSSPTATTNDQGVATVQLTAPTEGTATVTATAPGNISDSITVRFSDEQVSFTSPAAGARTNNQRPAIQGTSSGTAGETVRVTQAGAEVCVAPVQADGSWSCTPAADFAEGAVTLQAVLRDSGGTEISAPAALTFTIDLTAPAAPVITSPAADESVSPRPTISGTAEPGATVTVTLGGTTICTATADSSGNWSCTLAANLPNGATTISATATDVAGNTSPPATRSFTVDASAVAAPTITTTRTNSRTPVIAGTAEAGRTVRLTIALPGGGEVIFDNVAVSNTGAWSVNLATAAPTSGALPQGGLADGTYTLTAVARNNVGTTSTPTTATLTVDATAPAAPTVTAPAAGATVGPRPTISGTAEPGATVTVTLGGTTICTATVDSGGNWSCTLAASLPSGANTISVTATDELGNTSAPTTRSFTVNANAVAAPTITTTRTNSRTPVIAGTADAGATVRLTIALPGGGEVVFDNIAVGSTGAWSVNLATATPASGALPQGGLADGTYTLTAVARNNVGTASTPTTGTLRVDATAPAAPVISSPAANGRVGAFPVLTGTAEANSTVVVVVDPDGNPATTTGLVTYEVTANAQGAWTLNLASATPTSGTLGARGLQGGTQPSFTVRTRDAAGNLSQPATVRVTVSFLVHLPLVRR